MNEAEFDRFADEYRALHASGISASGEEPEFFAEYKIKDIVLEHKRHDGSADAALTILDFGAGVGNSVPYVRKHFPNSTLHCADISRRSLELAEERYPTLAQFALFDGTSLPFPDGHFDIAYAMCVFHHIDVSEHVSLLHELRRVIRPGGSLFVFEHNPFNPLTVRVVSNCPIDTNAKLIQGRAMKRLLLSAGFSITQIRYRMFFPHFLRILRPLELHLRWLPLGAQYYAMARK